MRFLKRRRWGDNYEPFINCVNAHSIWLFSLCVLVSAGVLLWS